MTTASDLKLLFHSWEHANKRLKLRLSGKEGSESCRSMGLKVKGSSNKRIDKIRRRLVIYAASGIAGGMKLGGYANLQFLCVS